METLTRRDRDVAALMPLGNSNRELAGALVISESTVEVHVKRILTKLGLRYRPQLAVRVVGRT